MIPEKKPLMQKTTVQEEKRAAPTWKHLIIIPGSLLLFIGSGMMSILQNEWIQHKIQHERFPNMSTNAEILACNNTNKTDPIYINYKSVQQESAMWIMYSNTALYIPMFLANMILPGYTDTCGRKFLFILSVLGICVKYGLMTAIIHWNKSLIYVLVINIVEGFTGSAFAFFAVSFSYIADIMQSDDHRILGIVSMEATVLLSVTLASLLSGYFIETLELGYFKTSLISSACCFLAFFIFILLLPETLPKTKRRPAKSIFGTFKSMVQFYISAEFKGKRLHYILLLLSFFVALLSGLNRTNLETLYFLGQPFCWGPSKIGVFTMTRYISFGLVGLCFLKILQKFLSNECIALLATVSGTASFVVEALARTNIMIYMVPVAGMLSFLMVPLIRGILSTMTEPDKQGALFSGVATIEVLSSILATLSGNVIYAQTYSFMDGFVFLVMAGFCVIDFGLLGAFYILKKTTTSEKLVFYETVENIND